MNEFILKVREREKVKKKSVKEKDIKKESESSQMKVSETVNEPQEE